MFIRGHVLSDATALHACTRNSVYAVEMRLLWLLVCPLIAQQAPFTPAPPILQIYREQIKPGKKALVAQIEQQAVRNQTELNSPLPYLTIASVSGPDELWHLNGYSSYADLDDFGAQIAAMPDLARLLADIPRQKADHVIHPRAMFARLRDDLSYGRGLTGAHIRFLLVSIVQVRPGHGADFSEIRRMVRGGHERARAADNLHVYEVESGMPDGTFLILSPAMTFDEAGALSQFHGRGVENALSPQSIQRLRELSNAAVIESKTMLFNVDPAMSYPAREWIEADVEFWRGNPAFSRR